jgi:hypothetical protein
MIYGLLVVEGLLWLSERLGWPAWYKGYAVLASVASLGVAMLAMLAWFVVSLVFRWRFQFSIRSLLVLTVAVALPCSWLGVEMQAARGQKDASAAIMKQGWGGVDYDYEFDASGFHPNAILGQTWLRSLLGDNSFADVVGLYFGERQRNGAVIEDLFNRFKIEDANLEQVGDLHQLRGLDLSLTGVTDKGLEHLERLKNLRYLWLSDTKVTDAGVEKLQRALPNCEISRR